MNNRQQLSPTPNQILNLMIVEDEPVFRLGLSAGLAQVPGLEIGLEVESSQAALRSLHSLVASPSAIPDLVILSLDLGDTTGQPKGLALCQQLGVTYPSLPVLLLSRRPNPLELTIALQAGAKGYCHKGSSIATIVQAIQQIAAGQPDWTEGLQVIAQALTTPQLPVQDTVTHSSAANFSAVGILRRNWRRSGLRYIEAAIAQLNTQLDYPQLTLLNELVLTGRRRELRAARWLVDRLLPPTVVPASPPASPKTYAASAPLNASPTVLSLRPTAAIPPSDLRSLQAALVDAVSTKFQSSLRNLTDIPLEIDILKEEKKRELLYLILRKLEEVLDDLRFSQIQQEQIADKQEVILRDLWNTATTDFFGKYYTLQLGTSYVQLVDSLLQDAEIIQAAILTKIPLVQAFLTHLLFQIPLAIDDSVHQTGTVEAMLRMELILQNLVIQIANAVIQPLLNRFGDVITIKQTFYDKRLLSSREIERFRNNLSWKYRVERYFNEPTAIFESRYRLFTVQDSGIIRTSIYAPRNQELAQLSGIPLVVTLALETRDAVAPRLRSAISFLGSGVVYVLTEVIGRGIGLIGRGVIKGVGNVLQDSKLSRNSERSR